MGLWGSGCNKSAQKQYSIIAVHLVAVDHARLTQLGIDMLTDHGWDTIEPDAKQRSFLHLEPFVRG